MGRSEQAGDDGIGDLVLDDIGRLASPRCMHHDLHIGDVGQGVERHMPQRPEPGQRQHHHSGEDQETIMGAGLDDSGQHHIPPSAFTRSCFDARTFPSLRAVIVTCQEPPDSRTPVPSYSPPPRPVSFAVVVMAAMPMAGIAGIKKVTVTSAPSIAALAGPESFTWKTLLPLCGVLGLVVKLIVACVLGAD